MYVNIDVLKEKVFLFLFFFKTNSIWLQRYIQIRINMWGLLVIELRLEPINVPELLKGNISSILTVMKKDSLSKAQEKKRLDEMR